MGWVPGTPAPGVVDLRRTQVPAKQWLAPVAQLDSASVFGTEGYRFESCRAYLKELARFGH